MADLTWLPGGAADTELSIEAEVAAILAEFCPDGVPHLTAHTPNARAINRDPANDCGHIDALAG